MWIPIEPDGSQRTFMRSTSSKHILILPAPGQMGMAEQEAFYNIGTHLEKRGVPVPHIYSYDRETGALIVEDLGSTSLYSIMEKRVPGKGIEDLIQYYEKVFETLIRFQLEGRSGFDPIWCLETQHYDSQLAAKKEALYFTRFFLERFLKRSFDADLEAELIDFARGIDSLKFNGYLLHRDFQSRNIFFKEGLAYMIDFQGARMGPLFYDVASVIQDPYVRFSQREKSQLFHLYLKKTEEMGMDIDEEDALREFKILSFFRLLQALGAYAYLSMMKKKQFFTRFIRPALENLEAIIISEEFFHLTRFKKVLKEALRHPI